MNHFDDQTIRDLEFDFLREILWDYCAQPTAKDRMRDLRPLVDHQLLRIELQKLDEFTRMRREAVSLPAIDFEELNQEIKWLQLKDSVLSEESFARIYKASALTNEIIKAFEGLDLAYPALFQLIQEIEPTQELIQAIEQVFTNKWIVKDDASDELRTIRSSIGSVRRQIAKNFAKVMKDLAGKGFLADTGEAYINERKVLAIYSTHKRKVSGVVAGSSKTGSLTYIEPEVNIQLNFELESLFDDERKEIRKILLALTNSIRHRLPLITAYQELLTELDFIQAKCRLALDLDANLPEISDEQVIDIKKAFHPVLFINNKRLGRTTFPQSLRMDKFSRMLVISGPNAGGKSITMKTIGLLQVMLQSGLLVPVGDKSVMSLFHAVLTDIGDNQSIENQLSTYSYRLKRMRHFLNVANKKSLVLLDEFGTGSDPDLGGALAEVFFEELYNRKSFGVITTHYSNIKLKAAQLRNAINGCMLFNTDTLEPTYRFSVGQPGSSFTFEVAEINGIPKEMIEAAKTKLSEQKVMMDEILSSLQAEKTRLEDLSKSADEAGRLASTTIQDFEKKKEKFEERLARQQETIERNNKYLNHGRRMAQFIESWNLRVKNKELLDEIKKYVVVEKTKIEEERKQRSLQKKVQKSKEEKVVQQSHRDRIKIGSLVRLENTKQTGKVLEMESGQAIVAFGVFKTKLDLSKLEFIQ
ncbi:MAG: endonuclease MutS2 [Flavobacteriales bacterium]|jgi:DNA mismatch repair protein MutS2